MKVGIIGGGIIGLCSAWYLNQAGAEVEIFEKTDGNDGCSFGNMGYLSPSHFIPLASPGIVLQGLKYMTNPVSPFYIKPRMNADLIRWAFHFWANATEKKVNESIPSLNALLQYSRTKTIEMAAELGNDFDLTLKGCYMMYRLEKTGIHESHLAEEAARLGIETETLDRNQLQEREPHIGVKALGAVLYPIDAHLHPGKWIMALRRALMDAGVKIHYRCEITDFQKNGKNVEALLDMDGRSFKVDCLVVASGSWLPEVVKKLSKKLLLQPGKGYSTTFNNLEYNLSKPAILVDDRVALTPFGSDLRVGGTMELSGINHTINLPRVQAILNAVKRNFETFDFSMPAPEKLWCGLRPVSPDGLPYIGYSKAWNNVVIAGGHAMLGVSMAAGTGKVVTDIIQQHKPAVNLHAFSPDRY